MSGWDYGVQIQRATSHTGSVEKILTIHSGIKVRGQRKKGKNKRMGIGEESEEG